MKTIQFLKVYPVVSDIILIILFLFPIFYSLQGGPYLSEYISITNLAFIVILILEVLPEYLIPSYPIYFTFKTINKKKKAALYTTGLFKKSKKYGILTDLQFSPIKNMTTRKIGKGKYEVDVSLQDGRKYTASVVPIGTLDQGAGMKLLINDLYGYEFDDLDL